MEVLILQVFVSLALVAGSVLLFAYSATRGDHQRGGHLALLPLEPERRANPPVHDTPMPSTPEGEER